MTQGGDQGLSDVLREMAGGGSEAHYENSSGADADHTSGVEAHEPAMAQAAPVKSHPRNNRPTAAGARSSPPRANRRTATPVRNPNRPVARSGSHNLKATAAPLLVTVGVLLLVPAFWSVFLLVGMKVPGWDRGDARSMAMAMLICWPLALALIAAAVVLFLQLMRDRKRPPPVARARGAR